MTGDYIMKDKKELLLNALRTNTAEIVFTKKDGTERKMLCTLQEWDIPKEHKPKGTGIEKTGDVISVYDLENKGWRSFRFDSLKSIVWK